MLDASDLVRYGLTRQQRRVCCMMARGLCPSQIAGELVVERATIYRYEHIIRGKLRAPDRIAAISMLREMEAHTIDS